MTLKPYDFFKVCPKSEFKKLPEIMNIVLNDKKYPKNNKINLNGVKKARDEIIKIYNDQILCQRGIHALSKPQQLSRPCYLVCEKRVSKQHLPAYSLSDDHHPVSIGDYLNKHDLKKLYSPLVDHGLFPIDKQWWQQTESP